MKKLLLFLLLIPTLLLGQVPDPIPNTYVNDLSKVLSTEQLHNLNEKILNIEKKSSVQIAIILINELPANIEIDQYTLEVGRKWHVGNAKNVLVYVAAINQHKQRLEVANNLQGDIPDIEALHITDNIKPFFRNKDYYGGINELLDGINKRVDPIIKEQLKLAAIEQEKKDENTKQGFFTFFMWLLSFGLLFVLVRFVFLRNYFKAKREEKEAEEERQNNLSIPLVAGLAAGSYLSRRRDPEPDSYIPPLSTPSNDIGSNSDDSSSNSDDSSSYGNWGSGSSDSGSSSSDSGFSGGGSSNDW